MTASLHKITAGDGYTYLTKNVAAGDTHRGRQSLSDYYSTRGETPGIWVGKGLKGFELNPRIAAPLGVENTARAGKNVSETQMLALFGMLKHPDAEPILSAALGKITNNIDDLLDSAQLGRKPPRCGNVETEYAKALRKAYDSWRQINDTSEIPGDARAILRTQVGIKTFQDRYQRAPEEGELESWIAKQSRPPRQPISGYDITFSAMKSVSVLWALADKRTTDTITRLHDQAIDEALEHLENTFLYTREGADGVRQVGTRGLIAAKFLHRDSRAGDPDLHTHVAIANRVQTKDGKWLSIDGREIYRWTVELSEYYNTRLIKHLESTLGVEFEPVVKRAGRAPVWEIAGIPIDLCEKMSRRRAAIEDKQAELVAAFRQTHGRIPTNIEQAKLAQQATLETRPAKKEPKSFHEQRETWRAQAEVFLGETRDIASVMAQTINKNIDGIRRLTSLNEETMDALADKIREEVSNKRATWQLQHVLAQVQRELRNYEIQPQKIDKTAKLIAEKVTGKAINLGYQTPKITGLTRINGTSVYQRADAEMYTTKEVLEAENQLLNAAKAKNYASLKPSWVEKIIHKQEQEGLHLTAAQSRMVTELATSGRALQLALAPAGTGKTTSMKVLADAWQAANGRVIGLSHQAVAAENLHEAIGDDSVCDTITSLTFQLRQPKPLLPEWAKNVDNHTLIIVDEAGMAATKDLALLATFANSRGASIRLIGDDHQLAAIEAGGILRDIAQETGAIKLTEVLRFMNPTEGEATIGLREGDKNALGFYTLHDRIHPVASTNATDDLFRAWVEDTKNGLNSLMLAAGLDDVTELNVAAQTWLASQNKVDLTRTIQLHDGTRAGVGDRIITRQNERRLAITATSFVKNRHRWQVIDVQDDGSLIAKHADTQRYIRLPKDYVATHVELGYASTITGAQGLTVDTAHTLIRGGESRALAYVGASRGRENNELYVSVSGDGDQHEQNFDQSEYLQTAVETLEKVLDVTGQQTSATTLMRDGGDPFLRLQSNMGILNDAIGQVCLNAIGSEAVNRLTVMADRVAANATANGTHVAKLSTCEAWSGLVGQLAKIAVTGQNPITALQNAITSRNLVDDQQDPSTDDAAILYWRLGGGIDKTKTGNRLVPEIPTIGTQLLTPQIQEAVNDLEKLRQQCIDDIQRIETTARMWTATNCPRWAQPLIPSGLVPEIACRRAITGVAENDLAPLGSSTRARENDPLAKRIATYVGETNWRRLVPAMVTEDPYWPMIALRLTALAKAHETTWVEAHMLGLKRIQLPIDQPASAYWYLLSERIRKHDQAGLNTRVVPIWAKAFLACCPNTMHTDILGSPSWPRFVQNVNEIPEIEQAKIVELAAKIATNTTQTDPGQWLETAKDAINQLKRMAAQGQLAQIPDVTDLPPEQRPLDEEPADTRIGDEQYIPVFDENGEALDTTTPQRILELNRAAADYFKSHYHGAPAEYIKSRLGTDLSADPRITIGYAPKGWDNLVHHLQETKNATPDELIDAGLAKYSSRGTLIDVFRDRVTIAMTDGEKILGFTGRANPADKKAPKYLNTPATKVFTKGKYLFGGDQLTPDAIPVLCEGPLDAIAITLKGDKNTTGLAETKAVGIAPGGTALTETQVKILSQRFPTNPLIVIATDNDKAGRNAAARDYQLLANAGADPRTIQLFEAKDPAEAAQTNPDMLAAQLEVPDMLAPAAISLIEQQKAKYIDSNTAIGSTRLDANQRAACVKNAIHLLAPIAEESRAFATKEIAHLLDIDTDPQWDTQFKADVEEAARIWLPPKDAEYDWQTIAAKYADRQVDWEKISQYAQINVDPRNLYDQDAYQTNQNPDIEIPDL